MKAASPRGRRRSGCKHGSDDTCLLEIKDAVDIKVLDALDDGDLQLARAVLLAVRRRLKVLGRVVASDRLLETRELDDDEAAEFIRALENF